VGVFFSEHSVVPYNTVTASLQANFPDSDKFNTVYDSGRCVIYRGRLATCMLTLTLIITLALTLKMTIKLILTLAPIYLCISSGYGCAENRKSIRITASNLQFKLKVTKNNFTSIQCADKEFLKNDRSILILECNYITNSNAMLAIN